MKEIETLTPPFADYPAFVIAFQTWFETVDEAGDALMALEQLWQGTKTVQDYTALFKQHAGCTRLSDDNKLIRYRKHLSTFIKDRLAETDWAHNTFNTIVAVATDIDKRHRERLAEKAREAGRSAPIPSSSKSPSGSHQTLTHLFQSPANPNAIDISAGSSSNGKTREDWRKAMRGKCYGYGSDKHTIAKGCPSKRAICQWCKKAGYTLAVCMTRHIGRLRNDGPPQPYAVHASTIPEASGSTTTLSGSASTARGEDVAAMVRQIAELNKSLMEIRGNFS